MKIDLRKFSKETIDKAIAVCNANDESKLNLLENLFAGDTAYAKLCMSIMTIAYNKGYVDGVSALTAKRLESNKEEKGGN